MEMIQRSYCHSCRHVSKDLPVSRLGFFGAFGTEASDEQLVDSSSCDALIDRMIAGCSDRVHAEVWPSILILVSQVGVVQIDGRIER